jgi:proteasome lid subunit RPN8/RPN11
VNTLILPQRVLDEARTFFENCGTRGFEGTAMIKKGERTELVIPEQRAIRDAHGQVSVEVTRSGQMELARSLAIGEMYVARIHSHPGDAYHSRTDNENPVLAHEGAISIVVPYFGLGLRRALDACAVLRRSGGTWHDLPLGPQRTRWITVEGCA